MNILVNRLVDGSYVEEEYKLVDSVSMEYQIDSLKRLYPDWTSMMIIIVNPKGEDQKI